MDITDNLSLRAVQLFMQVYREQSFSEVARQQDLSPAQVSRIIQQLEQSCGRALFYRNTRSIVPTEAGHQFMHTARHIVGELESLNALWLDQAKEPSGLVRLNAPVMFAQNHIVPWLPELMQRHPRLDIELIQTDEFVEPYRADLIFRIGALVDSTMKAKVFGAQKYYMAASPDYLKQAGTPSSLDDLAGHQFLPYRGTLGVHNWLVKEGQSWRELPIARRITSNSALSLVQMAVSGMGILLFPDWLLHPCIESGTLVPVLSDHEFSHYPYQAYVSALYPNTRHPQLNVRAVLDFLADKYGNPPYWQKP